MSLAHIKRLSLVFIGLALFSLPASADLLLKNIRFWTAPDHTRVVVDASGKPAFAHRVLAHPDRIAVDVASARFQGSTRRISVEDGLVSAIRLNELRSGKAQVVLDLTGSARYQVFTLDPVGEKPERLVIDVFRDAARFPAPGERPEGVRRVVIDAGHGGEDPGAIGLHRLREKDLTLDIARRLGKKIDAIPGFEAVFTRDGDYFISLKNRSRIAREKKGDLFVSIHANSARARSAAGFEIFFLSLSGATDKMARALANKENAADLIGGVSPSTEDEVLSILFDYLQEEGMSRSAVLAEQIYKRFEKDRSINTRNVKQAGFAVLKSMQMPAVLVEVGFLTNRTDAARLKEESYRDRLAGYLADGIREYASRAGGNGRGVRYHIVRSGETAWSIASRYRVPVEDLLKLNDLGRNTVLLVGQKLRIN